jgi:hypothetical protein
MARGTKATRADVAAIAIGQFLTRVWSEPFTRRQGSEQSLTAASSKLCGGNEALSRENSDESRSPSHYAFLLIIGEAAQ